MAAITVRRIEQAVIDRLKARAALNGRSMEEEARVAITRAAGGALRGPGAIDHFRRLRQDVFGGGPAQDSVSDLRALREGDPSVWRDE